MSRACDQLMEGAVSGVGATLRAVDCSANEMAAATFGRLFAPGGVLGPTLTLLLGLFVAIFAIGLMLGRTNASIRALVPRMMTLGLVLTFATSWLAYQSVVWNLAIGGPDWLASLLMGVPGSATQVFGDKIDMVMASVEQATMGGPAQVEAGQQAQAQDFGAFSPQGMVWLGAMLMLLGTVGVLVTARIALAVLVALGPIFVVMALFNGTRGLFAGWLKGVVIMALTPLFAVLSGGLMLEMAVPVLSSLNQMPGEIDARAAVGFFMVGAVHMALMVMVLKTLTTMVGGWRVFGFAGGDARAEREPAPAPAPVREAPAQTTPGPAFQSTAQAAGFAHAPRRIDLSGMAATPAANDRGGTGDTGRAVAASSVRRETKVFATSSGHSQAQSATVTASRARGIGSRFRPVTVRALETKQ